MKKFKVTFLILHSLNQSSFCSQYDTDKRDKGTHKNGVETLRYDTLYYYQCIAAVMSQEWPSTSTHVDLTHLK